MSVVQKGVDAGVGSIDLEAIEGDFSILQVEVYAMMCFGIVVEDVQYTYTFVS
jgi:hypothetical protein